MRYFGPLILLLILNNSVALAAKSEFTCMKSKVKLTYSDKSAETTTELCTNPDRTSLRSKNCKNLECIPRDKINALKFSDVFSEGSNPGFTTCMLSGGKPELLEFFADNQWYALDRCNFKNGFINVGALLQFLKKD